MGRSRDIADILSKTELANTGNEALITTFDAVDSAYVSSNVTPALVFYSTLDSLPVTSLTSGQQAYVSANSRLYISDGSGWYNKALITLSPTMTLSPAGTITLANDGVTTSTVTIVANDSDTPGSGLTYSVESDGNMLGRAVISQDSSVFTIRPLSSDSGATDGTFTLTFKTSDGVNLAFDSADFSLTFSSVVDASAETILLVKATGSGLENDAITFQNISDASTGFTEYDKPQASTFSPYRSGGYCTHHDGTGDTLTIPSSAAFAYGTGDFTWEAWIYVPAAKANHYLLDHGSNGGTMNIANTKVRYYNTTVGTGSALYTTGGTISYNTWHHVAFVRSSGTTTIYVDGVVGSSGSDTHNYGSQAITVGDYGSGGYGYAGYIRDLRLVKGTAVYTSAFTPPTEALTAVSGTELLACHLPYFADGSTNDHTITTNGNVKTLPFGPYDYSPWLDSDHGGSVFFDGTNDYIVAATDTNFGFGTGDFTIEMWVYSDFEKSGDYLTTFGYNNQGINHSYDKFRYYHGTLGGSNVMYTTGATGHKYSWNHVAVTRESGTTRIFANGKQGASTTVSHSWPDYAIALGCTEAGTGAFMYDGYIADARYVKGTAIYTSNFTPPTAPLPHVSNTVLRMNNKSDANIYDAAAGNVLVSIDDLYGNGVQSNTTPRKFTTSSSMFFSSDGSYLLVPTTELLGFGTGDFTWELWIWSNGMIPSYILEFGTGGDNGIHYPTAEGHLSYHNSTVGTGSTLYTTGFSTFSSSTWMHIAASRVNGTTYLFKDGTLTTSASDSHDYGTSNALYIGTYGATPGSYGFYGRMQDIRITKGTGRYTSSFTAPTAEFEL